LKTSPRDVLNADALEKRKETTEVQTEALAAETVGNHKESIALLFACIKNLRLPESIPGAFLLEE